MSPRVDFYLLNQPADAAPMFCCRLVDKAYRQGLNIHVRLPDKGQADLLDRLLWTFRQDSFIPHALDCESGQTDRFPVQLGVGAGAEDCRDLLISLCPEVPEDFEHYGRIAEIVASDEASRAAARLRFKHYREQGLNPDTHQMDERPA